jgi:hypothetical protein
MEKPQVRGAGIHVATPAASPDFRVFAIFHFPFSTGLFELNHV